MSLIDAAADKAPGHTAVLECIDRLSEGTDLNSEVRAKGGKGRALLGT